MEPHLKEYDIVIFGATGFTGHFVVEEVARVAEEEQLSWAVAGRKMHKLQNMLDKTGKRIGRDLDNTPVILADVCSEVSLNEMCRKTKVLINCVGPYNYHGDAVIQACIKEKADQVDICGETYFLEKSQLMYNGKAREAGVYIVGGCGFDSIPAEMGVIFTEQTFTGDLLDVENFIELHHKGAGITAHSASIESFMIDLSYVWEVRKVRSHLLPNALPLRKYKSKRLPIFYSREQQSWCIPMINADVSCVERTQNYLYAKRKKRPVYFHAYLCRPNFLWIIGILGFGLLWGVFGLFSWTRKVLCKFPRLFTAGFFSHDGPSIAQIEGTSFTMTFKGTGYSAKSGDPNSIPDQKPDKKVVTKVTGPEMGYVTTPICLVQAAVVLLKERDRLPSEGGVYSPGAVFYDTSLIQRLDAHNLKFSVVNNA